MEGELIPLPLARKPDIMDGEHTFEWVMGEYWFCYHCARYKGYDKWGLPLD